MRVLPSHRFRRIYVWELPLRIYHWVTMLAILLLMVTGYLIGNPISFGVANEAYEQYWFGIIRFSHFVAAFVLVFAVLFRLYWSFVGNRFARWRALVPTTRKRWREMLETLRVDIFQVQPKGRIPLGHNALAGLAYFVLLLVVLFQAATGFALYASMSSLWLPKLFTWVVPLMGGDMAVRYWHHAAMWFFVVFILNHVYLVIYHDYVEGRGTASSIVGGWKFEREDVLQQRR